MMKETGHIDLSDGADVDKRECSSVWDELAQSEILRKDLQCLYELRSRRQRNLNRFLKNIDGCFGKKRIAYYAIAGMVTLLIGFSVTFRLMYGEEKTLSSESQVLIPGIYYNISLKLSTGKNHVLTDSRIFLFESDGINITASSKGKVEYDDRAFLDSLSDKVLYNELIVPRGRECEITLSDGTQIYLNAQSKLIYPVSFKGKIVREVYMEGEAYMKVAHNSSSPFVVKSPRLQAKVLGTSFNIKDYPDDNVYGIALVEGKLQVNNELESPIVLLPGEEVYGDKDVGVFGKKERADMEGATAWMHETLYFNNRTLGDIAKELERRYDICVRFDSPETARYSFLVKAQKFSCIEHVLELLRLTRKVDYSVEGRTVTVFSQCE